jgi:hypothetical protein
VVGEEGPGEDGPGGLLRQGSHPGDEVGPIRVVPEDGPPFEAAYHDMVQGVRGIEAGLARHRERKSSTTCSTWHRPVLRDGEPVLAGVRRDGAGARSLHVRDRESGREGGAAVSPLSQQRPAIVPESTTSRDSTLQRQRGHNQHRESINQRAVRTHRLCQLPSRIVILGRCQRRQPRRSRRVLCRL